MKFSLPLLAGLLAISPLLHGEGEREAIDRLTPAEIKNAWEKLNELIQKSGGIDPVELERARLQGVLERLGKNARLLPAKPDDQVEKSLGFRSEMLPRSILYLKVGNLTADNVSQLREILVKNRSGNAVILDLRSTSGETNYSLAAKLAALFAGGGKTLFSISHGGESSLKNYSGEGDSLFSGITLVLLNEDSGGAAETISAVLRQQIHALIVGKKTIGRALEFTSLPLGNQTNLEIATGRVELPGKSASLLANGLTPDLPVVSDLAGEREMLERSTQEGMATFIFEIESPHMNEASLVAGKNPELDAYQARKARKDQSGDTQLIDHTLQRALDTATSLIVLKDYGKK